MYSIESDKTWKEYVQQRKLEEMDRDSPAQKYIMSIIESDTQKILIEIYNLESEKRKR